MTGWLRGSVHVARSTLLVIAFGVGMLAAGGIVVATIALQEANSESGRAQRVDRLTRGDVAAIARRIARIEQPTAAELLRRVEVGIRLCAMTPSCARRFRGVASAAAATRARGDASSASTGATRLLEPAATRRDSPARRDRSGTPATRRPRPSKSPSTGDSSGPGGGDASPGSPRPIVDIPAPGPVQVCTPLVGVNC